MTPGAPEVQGGGREGAAEDGLTGFSVRLTTQAGAHEAAIGWLTALGHHGASRCHLAGRAPRTACTLASTSALARLRLGPQVTDADALRDLVTDARRRDVQLFYFTSGSYSHTALAFADMFGIALFTYDRTGILRHANAAAMAAILDAPDDAAPHDVLHLTVPGAPASAEPFPSTAQDPGLRTWATSAWQARQAAVPRRAWVAYLPLAMTLFVGLLVLAVGRAWPTAADAMQVRTVIAAAVVFHACCLGGVLRVARWRGQLREHGLHVAQACTLPGRARAVVEAVMQRTGRGVPHDREAFVLLRNEVMASTGLDAFTAGVLLWESTIGAARPADREEWLGVRRGGRPSTV